MDVGLEIASVKNIGGFVLPCIGHCKLIISFPLHAYEYDHAGGLLPITLLLLFQETRREVSKEQNKKGCAYN